MPEPEITVSQAELHLQVSEVNVNSDSSGTSNTVVAASAIARPVATVSPVVAPFRFDATHIYQLIRKPISSWGLVIAALLLFALVSLLLYESYQPVIANLLRGVTSLGGTLTLNSLGNCYIEIKKIYTTVEPVIEDVEDIVSYVQQLSAELPSHSGLSIAAGPRPETEAATTTNTMSLCHPSISFCGLWRQKRTPAATAQASARPTDGPPGDTGVAGARPF